MDERMVCVEDDIEHCQDVMKAISRDIVQASNDFSEGEHYEDVFEQKLDEYNLWKADEDEAIKLIEYVIDRCYSDKDPEELRSHIGDIQDRVFCVIPGKFIAKYINQKIKYDD